MYHLHTFAEALDHLIDQRIATTPIRMQDPAWQIEPRGGVRLPVCPSRMA
jgi:hypothetical protein